MNIFLKVVASIMVAVIAILLLSKHKDISLLITITVCCMTIIVSASYLQTVINFFISLQTMCDLDPALLSVILKTAGIGILSEITCLICEDAGQASLSKTLKILTGSIMLCMSIPLFTSLLDLINKILVST